MNRPNVGDQTEFKTIFFCWALLKQERGDIPCWNVVVCEFCWPTFKSRIQNLNPRIQFHVETAVVYESFCLLFQHEANKLYIT